MRLTRLWRRSVGAGLDWIGGLGHEVGRVPAMRLGLGREGEGVHDEQRKRRLICANVVEYGAARVASVPDRQIGRLLSV